MSAIPNELFITINTSIPGYQTIQFKPSMIIKDINPDDKTIQFDPLIKLQKSIIKNIPNDLKKKQFFNKGLFQSLINYTNSSKVKDLVQAMRNGYIDNNIRVTLDTIFDDNSIINIGGNPYTIADVLWENGDWKIDTKFKKEEINKNLITDPMLYQAVVKEDIISGEEELKRLPNTLIYGNNYNKNVSDIARGIEEKKKNELLQSEKEKEKLRKEKEEYDRIEEVRKRFDRMREAKELEDKQRKKEEDEKKLIENKLVTVNPIKSITSSTNQLRIKNDDSSLNIEELTDETLPVVPINKQIQIQPTEEPSKLKASVNNSNYFKSVIKSQKFYELVNNVYTNSPAQSKTFIRNTLRQTTTIGIKEKETINLSKSAYNQSVDSLKITNNEGNGDCFFIAVADAINNHNYYNQNNRIISGPTGKKYGSGNNFYTQSYLRSIVYDFLLTWDMLDTQFKIIAPAIVNELNTKFKNELDTIKAISSADNIEPEQYVQTANNVYMANDNFLVENITQVPINVKDYESPFKVLPETKLKEYIMSNKYWANEVALYALSKKLKLNIIPISIKNTNKNNNISIPFWNFIGEYDTWNKYMFLFYSGAHYELIHFEYTTKVANESLQKFVNKTTNKFIFNRGLGSDLPPFYILFIIYASAYNSLDDKLKKGFTFYNDIMSQIENSVNQLCLDKDKNKDYFNNFTSYFNRGYKCGNQHGGQYPPRYQYQYPPQYQQRAIDMFKRNNDLDKSKIAYYITIDMVLYPGTSISPEEIKTLKCQQKWNAIRKSYASFIGKPYVIPPVYQKTVKNRQEIPDQNTTQNKRVIVNNNTQKAVVNKGGRNHTYKKR
jgi:hypothetical protein